MFTSRQAAPPQRNAALFPAGLPADNRLRSRAAHRAAKQAASAPVLLDRSVVAKPLSRSSANFFGGIAAAFSSAGAKAVLKYGGILAAGAAIGAIICSFAAPHLPALIASMTASAAFPPVMIAIGVTVGVAALAFGIYKFVKMSKAKAALNAEVLAAKNSPMRNDEAQVAQTPAPTATPVPAYTAPTAPTRRTPPPRFGQGNEWADRA